MRDMALACCDEGLSLHPDHEELLRAREMFGSDSQRWGRA